MEFIAVDVETANADMSSICSIGIVQFKDGEVARDLSTLINPECDFDPINIAVHGIKPEHVIGKPTMQDLYPILLSHFANIIVVHHTHFDRTALRKVAANLSLPELSCRWLDSAKMARRAWERFSKRGYGLSSLAAEFQIDFEHHRADEDARCAGLIAVRAINETGIPIHRWCEMLEDRAIKASSRPSRRAASGPKPEISNRGAPVPSEENDTAFLNRVGGKRIADRQIDELIGLARGLIADGRIEQSEVEFLQKWLAANSAITDEPLIAKLYNRVAEVLADGMVDAEEKVELLDTLDRFSTRDLELGEVLKSTALPLCQPAPILSFDGWRYCFTGTFNYGTRTICENVVAARGAAAGSLTKKTDVLVIGIYATESWKHSSFGNKILRACEWRDSGIPISIVSEDHWVKALG